MKSKLFSLACVALLSPIIAQAKILPRPAQWNLEVICKVKERDSNSGKEVSYTVSAPIVDLQNPEQLETYGIAGETNMPGEKSAGINFSLRMFPLMSIRADVAIDVKNLKTTFVDTSKARFQYLINVYEGEKNQVFTSDDIEYTGLKYRTFNVTYDITESRYVQVSCKPQAH